MAYIALPTRDSNFLLLANAAPRLPRSAIVTASASCSSVDGAPVRPMRVYASRLCCAHLSSNFHPRGRRVFAAVEGGVTVEEPAISTASDGSEEEAAAAEAVAAPAGEGTEPFDAPAKTLQRSNTVRRQATGAKRELTVTTEQLVAGAVFTGKVRAVQSYGAFVDIGAFTDGLVHISQLSSGYVKEVSDVVTVGQEVSVTVVELNENSGRIALSMRDKESEAEQEALRAAGESGVQGDGSGKPMNRGKIAGRGGGTARSSSRSNDDRKATKLKKGQELKGTVKNIIRNGAFIAFAEEGEEGFLRGSEITEGGENVAVDSLLTVGQEVTVRVLKIERGKAALTMKPQVDMTSINDSLNTNVGAGGASNPFATFFRSANLVPAAAPAASVDAQEEAAAPAVEEETPAAFVDAQVDTAGPAVEETSAALETPAVEDVFKTEDTPAPAVAETPAVSVDAQVEVGGPSLDEETPAPAPAVEEPSAILETPAVQEVTETEDTPAPAVGETPAVSVDAQVEVGGPSLDEETPAPAPAVEEPSAILETPAVQEVTETEDTPAPAVRETPAVSVDAQVEAGGPSVDEETPAPAPAVETPAVEEVSKTEDTPAPAVGETPAVSVDAQVEVGGPSLDEETPAPAPAVEEPSAILETPAVQEVTETEDTPAPTVAEPPAVEGTSSPEAAQSEEAPAAAEESADDSSQVEGPRSLSLGEIAEGIGGAVAEVEKVAETAAEFLNVGDKDDGGSSVATRAPSSEETESRAEEAQPVAPASGQAAVEASPEPEIVPEAAAPTPVLDESGAEAAPVVEEPKAEAAAPVAEEAAAAAVPSGPTAAQVKELREKSGAGMMECKKALVACGNDVSKASEYLRKKGLAGAEKKSSRIAAEGRVGSYVHDGRMGVLVELNCETDFVSRGTQFKELVADMGMQVVACPDVRYVSVADVPAEFVQKEREIEMGKEDLASKPPQIREKIVEGRIAKRLAELALLEQAYIRDDKLPVKDLVKETTAKLGEKVQIRRFVRFNLGEGLQKKSSDFAAEVAAQTAAKADVKAAGEAPPKVEEAKKEAEAPKVAVSAATVKELRDATGAGMMDCKKALAACENDVSKATDYLRKKGLASADKKSGRVASEGLIGSYIHDGRIGVLVEVNSETDFVARSAQFKELVANIGMQVAACPQAQYVSVDEIPASFVEKEKEIEMGKEDLGKRPEAVRSKIVEGRVAKTLNELALLEQPYIRDDKLLVKDYVKQTVAALGENIQVRRFARFNLGEGIEKRSTDFAAEVAAQTGSKA